MRPASSDEVVDTAGSEDELPVPVTVAELSVPVLLAVPLLSVLLPVLLSVSVFFAVVDVALALEESEVEEIFGRPVSVVVFCAVMVMASKESAKAALVPVEMRIAT